MDRRQALLTLAACTRTHAAPAVSAAEDADRITIATPHLEAAIRKKGYVSGVAAQSFVDRRTGFRDAGFGLDIVDWIMEP
ncbi:MAG: hypothetical protein ACKV22_13825, partial [Bryobacteraceae bacterium]